MAERAQGAPLSAVADSYLTSRHRDNPGAGCLLAALGPDVSRQGPAVRRSVTDYVRGAVDLVTTMVLGKSKAARRRKGLSTYATLVGTMVMVSAVDDRALSQEILDAAWRLSKPDAANHCARGSRDPHRRHVRAVAQARTEEDPPHLAI